MSPRNLRLPLKASLPLAPPRTRKLPGLKQNLNLDVPPLAGLKVAPTPVRNRPRQFEFPLRGTEATKVLPLKPLPVITTVEKNRPPKDI